ncbi:MAG: bifunctional lysylphosphatidylglycerol flippase/synthetase MprF [Candidatus Wallbacteria bacterium]|nr:bifunctional lysylphosphatidylglycerol flippase/synthetase MprF [Candidatus Wallbacteria bacterium]
MKPFIKNQDSKFISFLLSNLKQKLGLILFAVTLFILFHALKEVHYRDIVREVHNLPPKSILIAAILTAVNFFLFSLYDTLAFRHFRFPINYPRIAFTACISYSLGNTTGLSIVSGSALRTHLYSVFGFTYLDSLKIGIFNMLTLALGICGLGALTFSFGNEAIPGSLGIPAVLYRSIGFLLFLSCLAFILVFLRRVRKLSVSGIEMELPSSGTSLIQLLLGVMDLTIAGSVLFVLLPAGSEIHLTEFLSIFLLSTFSGIVSTVPGGLGVFELVMVKSLSGYFPAQILMGSILAFRGIYYLIPLTAGLLSLAANELLSRRSKFSAQREVFKEALSEIVPSTMAFLTFTAGAVLLFSGSLPPVRTRMLILYQFLPLPFVEISHFLGSITGTLLLIIAHGLYRRLDAAYYSTILLLFLGAAFSLVKGLNYEEAALFLLIAVLLIPNRIFFNRATRLSGRMFSGVWTYSMLLVVLSSLWLGFFSYKHVQFTSELWWKFALMGGAPRFLRAEIGIAIIMLLYGMHQLFKAGQPDFQKNNPEIIAKVEGILKKSIDTSAFLSLLGDKLFHFSESGNAFIMFGAHGNCFISMGDPVGPSEEIPGLIGSFRDLCDQYDREPVFYEISDRFLSHYLDVGLSLVKIGETGRIRLSELSLQGKKGSDYRQTINRMEHLNCRFEVISREHTGEILPRMKEISDQWLQEKNTREKGFSLGFFDAEYLSKFPTALVFQNDVPLAFANLLESAGNEESSIDLMRFSPASPGGSMDYLLTRTIFYAKDKGYKYFNLGMAPLSGLPESSAMPVWNRTLSFVYKHGEHFYNFQGLRKYKEKFSPEWRSCYLATTSRMRIPQALINVSAVISGGVGGILKR